MKKVLFSGVLLFFLLTVSADAFQLYLPDEGHKLNLKSNIVSSVLIENVYKDTIAVKIDFEKDLIRQLPEGTPDCSVFIKAYPKLVILKPGEKQIVKFIARQAGKCRVFFTIDRESSSGAQNSDASIITINLRYKVGIPVDVE